MLEATDLVGITSEIFAATLDPVQWNRVVESLSSACGGMNTQIMGYDQRSGISVGAVSQGYSPEYFGSFMDYYSSINPWAAGFGSFAVGEVVPLSAYCDERTLMKTEFYNDWVLPQEDLISGGGALLQRSEHCLFLIGGNIRRRDQERLEPRWLDIIRQTLPILRQAWSVSQALAGGVVERSVLGVAKTGDPAIFVVDEEHRLLFSNAAGHQAVETARLLRLDQAGRLTFADPQVDARVKHASHPFDSFEVGRGDLSAFRIHRAAFDPDALGEWHLGLTLGIVAPCTVLVLEDLGEERDKAAEYFRARGLTRAEMDIAEAIAAGQKIGEIADARNVTRETVRNQLKAVFSKCSVGRQSELVRLVATIRI